MATLVLTDAFFSWDGTDLSDHVRTVTLNYEADLLDDTAMGDTTRSRKGGLFNWTCDIEFYSDEASSKVQQTFFSDVGAVKTLIVRGDNSGGVGVTNPNYTGSGILGSIPLVSGSVGEMQMAPVHIESAGALTRVTS